MIESEFNGVRKHSGSPCHTMDQWSTQLFMCSNWLAVLPHADNTVDVLDHGHKNRMLEPCGNIITGYQASNKKQRGDTLLFQYTMTFTYPKELMRPHTSLRQPCTCNVHTWVHANMHPQAHTQINDWFQQLVVSFHWRNAREDFCSALISGSDILHDFGHSPDQRGRKLSQKKSQGMHSEADVSISTTLHC